jgi:glycosyltransferase involved in cell wall biosynthesis
MDKEKIKPRVTAIVPAYNEGPRIGSVLDVLTTYEGFEEVIVIDDHSSDNTGGVAKTYGVKYIRNPENYGKGRSMDIAVRESCGEVIFFADADVKGINHAVVNKVLAPVLRGETSMFIAMRNRKIYYLRFLMPFIPLLGGERALKKSLWEKVPDDYKRGFRIEAALNFYAKYYDNGLNFEVFHVLSQEIKERKYGLFQGLRSRFKMFYEIIGSQLYLERTAVPQAVKSGRIAVSAVVTNLLGLATGALILAALWYGPVQFIDKIFAEELYEDPSAPFVHLLIKIAGHVSIGTIAIVDIIIIGLNSLFLTVNWKNALLSWKRGLFSKHFVGD